MKIIHRLLPMLILLAVVSCKEQKGSKLIGLWQETAVINPQLDGAVEEQKLFADTVGNSTDSLQNISLYGTDNIENMRAALRANLDSFRMAQIESMNATRMEFREDSMMYIHTIDGVDSSKWYIDEDGGLILDEAAMKGAGNKIRMDILHLSDTMLKLQFTEKFLSSTSVFKPVKK